MSVYFVVQEEVHDPDGLNAYMEAAKASSLGRRLWWSTMLSQRLKAIGTELVS